MKSFLHNLINLDNLSLKHWLIIFLLYTFVHFPAILNDHGKDNLAVHQANAFLHKRLDIDKHYWDAATYNNKYYVSFPPFPSLVVLPFAALFNGYVNSVLISVLLSCISMYYLYRLLTITMANSAGRKWVFLGFFLGTGYWYAVLSSHHINGFAHVVCTTLLILLLYELFTKQRAWMLGILLGAAFLSRQMTIFYGILVLFCLYDKNRRFGYSPSQVLTIGLTFSVFAAAYLIFNYFRFDDFFNTGYEYITYKAIVDGSDMFKDRVENLGLFNAQYFWFNFYHMFIKGHNIIFEGESLLKIRNMDFFGTSLLAASPFIIFAVKSTDNKQRLIGYWVTVILIMVSLLFYHNNGWKQVNTQRFTLDFIPALMILVAGGYEKTPSWLFRAFVIYAIALNVLSFTIHLITD